MDAVHLVSQALNLQTYLGPLCGVPLDRTVEHIAVLPVRWGWLWTHVVWYDDGVSAASRHLMDAVHVSGLDADAAVLAAG